MEGHEVHVGVRSVDSRGCKQTEDETGSHLLHSIILWFSILILPCWCVPRVLPERGIHPLLLFWSCFGSKHRGCRMLYRLRQKQVPQFPSGPEMDHVQSSLAVLAWVCVSVSINMNVVSVTSPTGFWRTACEVQSVLALPTNLKLWAEAGPMKSGC